MKTIEQLERERAQTYREMCELNRHVEARDGTYRSDEEDRWRELEGRIEMLDRQIEKAPTSERADQDLGSHVERTQSSDIPQFRTASGQEVRGIRPEDSFSEYVQQNRADDLPDGIQPHELDFGRLLRGLVTGNWRDARAEQRILQADSDALGGFSIPDVLSGRVIDYARNKSSIIRAGVTTLPWPSEYGSVLKLLAVDTPPTVDWKGEGAAASFDTAMRFGVLELKPKLIFGLVEVTRELMEDSPNVGEIIQRELAAEIALKLDYGALRGDGGSEILGLRNWTGINTRAKSGADMALDDISQAAQSAMENNSPGPEDMSLIMSPRTYMNAGRFVDGVGQYLTSEHQPWWWSQMRKIYSGQIPVNLGAGSDESEVFIGPFRDFLVAIRRNITFQISTEAGDALKEHKVYVAASMRMDAAPQHASWFTVITGLTN